MADDDNVIPFSQPVIIADEPRRVFKRKRADYSKPVCLHRHYEIAMHEADVSCQDCGAQLDPWQVLRDLATQHENTWAYIESSRIEQARLLREIEALKKERSRLRRGLPREVTQKIHVTALFAKETGDGA